jgi:hypothetical protein
MSAGPTDLPSRQESPAAPFNTFYHAARLRLFANSRWHTLAARDKTLFVGAQKMRSRSNIVVLGFLCVCAGCATELVTPAKRLAQGKALFEQRAYLDAVTVLNQVMDDESSSPERRSEALYWKAESFAAQGEMTNAYRTAKQLVWSFPSTKWAGRYNGKLPIWETNNTPQPTSAGDVLDATPEK